MKRVRYIGAEPAINREVGDATGRGDLLEAGAVYTVSAELARRLVASSAAWETVKDSRARGGKNSVKT